MGAGKPPCCCKPFQRWSLYSAASSVCSRISEHHLIVARVTFSLLITRLCSTNIAHTVELVTGQCDVSFLLHSLRTSAKREWNKVILLSIARVCLPWKSLTVCPNKRASCLNLNGTASLLLCRDNVTLRGRSEVIRCIDPLIAKKHSVQ